MLSRAIKFVVIFSFLIGFEFLILFLFSFSGGEDFLSISSNCIFSDSSDCSIIQIGLLPIIFIAINLLIAFVLSKSQIFVDNSTWKPDVKNRLSQIQGFYSSKDSSQLKFALMEADKILGFALMKYGIKGNTTYERIKNAEKLYDYKTFKSIKHAHYIRNKLAHEVGFEITNDDLKTEFWALRNAIMKLVS